MLCKDCKIKDQRIAELEQKLASAMAGRGRKPIGAKAMTSAERSARRYAKKKDNPSEDYINAGTSTCPCCQRFWVVTPADDCLLPACGCYGQDVASSNPARPCQMCGLAHTNSCSKMDV